MVESPARARPLRAAAAAIALLAAACASEPPPAPPEPEPVRFDAERALEHVRTLAEAGPRGPGAEGAKAARAYLRSQLSELGLEVRTLEPEEEAASEGEESEEGEAGEQDAAPADEDVGEEAGEGAPALHVENVMATIPPAEGGSEDLLLLAAPYDTGADERAGAGTSGAALVLELARVLRERPLPYAVRLAFLQGERPEERAEGPAFAGSRALWRALGEEGVRSRLRLLVYVDRVCTPEIRVARDLFSERAFRERLFDAAEAAGHAEAFPASARFDEVAAGHRVFFARGFRRTVALVASSAAGAPSDAEAEGASGGAEEESAGASADEAPTAAEGDGESDPWEPGAEGEGAAPAEESASEGAARPGPEEGCDPASLAAVGATAEHGLREIAAMLRKVDRFANRPEPEPAEEPEGEAPGGADAEEAAETEDAPAGAPEPDPGATDAAEAEEGGS